MRGFMLKKAVILLSLFASPALAQESPKCLDFDKLVQMMKGMDANPFMYVLSEEGKAIFVFFGNEKTGEWVVFRRDANSKQACMVNDGVGFGVIPEYRGPGI